MLPRRIAAATFAIAVALVVACGHQVTPNPPTSDLAGRVVVKVRLNGPVDFTDYSYAIVIDTCGGMTPYPDAYNTSLNSYSYGFFIGSGFQVASAQLIAYFVDPNSSGSIISKPIPENGSLQQLIPDSNPNEFQFVFTRSELSDPEKQAKPCPDLPAVPTSPSPSSSAGASPTSAPSSTASPSAASPSATTTPFPYPTQPSQVIWKFNFFTIQGGSVADSLGFGGPHDASYDDAILDTSSVDDVTVTKVPGGQIPSNSSLQVAGGEIQNYP